MPLFAPKPPADVLASLRVHLADAGEQGKPRVLAWAPAPEGAIVALDGRLAVLEAGVWTSTPWHELLHATWNDEGSILWWTTVDAPQRPHETRVLAPGRLPDVIFERLKQTFVASRTVTLAPGKGGTLMARRPATSTDAADITWLIVPARGTNLKRPEIAEAAQRILDAARRDWA